MVVVAAARAVVPVAVNLFNITLKYPRVEMYGGIFLPFFPTEEKN